MSAPHTRATGASRWRKHLPKIVVCSTPALVKGNMHATREANEEHALLLDRGGNLRRETCREGRLVGHHQPSGLTHRLDDRRLIPRHHRGEVDHLPNKASMRVEHVWMGGDKASTRRE